VAAPVFFHGELVATPGTLTLLADEHANPAELLACHKGGHWGEVVPKMPASNAKVRYRRRQGADGEFEVFCTLQV
jgi:hypothetical protein